MSVQDIMYVARLEARIAELEESISSRGAVVRRYQEQTRGLLVRIAELEASDAVPIGELRLLVKWWNLTGAAASCVMELQALLDRHCKPEAQGDV